VFRFERRERSSPPSVVRAYLLERLLAIALTLFGVSLLVFGMVRLIPGTVVEQLLGQASIGSPEVVASFRQFFGLDQPVHLQYLTWLGGILRGDLGVSWLSGKPVLRLFLDRLPVSSELAVLSIGWSLLLGVPLGTASAVWRGGLRDSTIRVAATLGLSLPAFWQGTVLILLFSLYLGWMPSLQWVPLTRDVGANLAIMSLPALTLGTASAAMITRMSRSSMLDVLGREFVRTARAKGVRESRVHFHHALRNALIPVVTVAGVQLGYIVGGIVVVEDVFTLPGVGRLLLDAIFQRDYPVVQGVVLLLAAGFMAINLLVDLLYAALDPRLRIG
jgi:peptide/nickel transport system permease protein